MKFDPKSNPDYHRWLAEPINKTRSERQRLPKRIRQKHLKPVHSSSKVGAEKQTKDKLRNRSGFGCIPAFCSPARLRGRPRATEGLMPFLDLIVALAQVLVPVGQACVLSSTRAKEAKDALGRFLPLPINLPLRRVGKDEPDQIAFPSGQGSIICEDLGGRLIPADDIQTLVRHKRGAWKKRIQHIL